MISLQEEPLLNKFPNLASNLRTMPHKSWKKVLVIRFSSIGDIVLTTPIVRCLHKAGFEVHYLTKVHYKDILSTNPYIDKLWTLDEGLQALVRPLRKCRFDGIIDLHQN